MYQRECKCEDCNICVEHYRESLERILLVEKLSNTAQQAIESMKTIAEWSLQSENDGTTK